MWELYTGQLSFKNVHYAAFYETVVLRNVRPFIPPDMPEDYRWGQCCELDRARGTAVA